MPRNRRLGGVAEDAAAAYLQNAGYTIVTRNFHARSAEIDIVAMDGDVVVCVEVRERRSGGWDEPEATIDARKQARLWQAAEKYLSEIAGEALPVRFDVVAIKDGALRHHKDAFRPE